MTTNSTLDNISQMTVWTSVATMIGVVAMAAVTGKALLAPVQAISHILFGPSVLKSSRVDLMKVGFEFILNILAMIGWCSVAELVFQVHGRPAGTLWVSALVSGAVTMLAYFVDFRVVPKRLTPGFEHVLSRRSLYLVYLGLALAMCLGSIGRVA